MKFEDRILSKLAILGERLSSARVPLVVAGTILFVAGTWWSFGQLDLSVRDLEWRYLAALLLLMVPASLLYSGIGLQIVARSGGVSMPIGKATVVACYATLAEALPIPGGAIVRAGALMTHGVGLARSVALVTANALLWIALAAAGAGLAIIPYTTNGAASLILLGGVGTLVILGWLIRSAGVDTAAYSLLHRVTGIVLLSLRLFLAFQAIGVALPFVNAFPFALTTIAGAASSITPAGVGISELLGALMASVVQMNPAAAFIVVGLDRVLVYIVCGLGVLTDQIGGNNRDT